MGVEDRPAPTASARRTSVRSSASTSSPEVIPKLCRTPSGIAPLRAQSRASVNPLSISTATEARNFRSLSTPEDDVCAEVEAAPSPTAMRLQSLARSVRAVRSLGALKVRKKYIASSPLADRSLIDGKPRAPPHLLVSRVVTLPSNEFSTEEMKFRLDPLEPAAPSTGSVHGVLDALANSTSTTTQEPMTRPASTRGLVPPPGSAKTKWKNAAARTPSTVTETNQEQSTRRGSTAPVGSNPEQPFHPLFSVRGSEAKDFLTSTQPTSTSTSSTPNIEARLCCARSLYKLSCQSGSELAIIQGGAIAQIAEISDLDHPLLHELCAATLANLTTDSSAIDTFVQYEGLAALLELSWSPSILVKTLCLTALCRLSCRAAHAAQMAKTKASIEFLAMMSLPSEPLQMLAIRCLLNLIFFGHTFPDRVLLGEPHAIRSELGVMNLTSQFASSPPTMAFATEVLFNLGLHRTSCSGALRGGGSDILHGLALQVTRALEDHGSSSSSLASSSQVFSLHTFQPQPTPRLPITIALTLLRLIAQTLANFSSHVEFHVTIAGSAMKTLTLLLGGALRDLGSRFYGGLAEERMRVLAVPCSRALANLSSSEEGRRASGLTPELVYLVAKLFMVNRFKLFAEDHAASTAFALNTFRAVANVSYCESCAAHLMEFGEVLPHVARIMLKTKEEVACGDGEDDDSDDDGATDDDSAEDDYGFSDDDDRYGEEGTQKMPKESSDSMRKTMQRRVSTTSTLRVYEQLKEDALVTVLNLAHQGVYAHELLKHVDGKQLARAAEGAPVGAKLRYLYDVLLSSLLFESRLQQIVYGDLVVTALLDGYTFFSAFSTAELAAFKTASVLSNDDQERFMAAIATIAGELQDSRNIERLVQLALTCIRPGLNQRRAITCYAASILHALARSAAQRSGDSSAHHYVTTHSIYAPETVLALVAVCESDPLIYCATTQTYCAATLYQICAVGHATPRVVQALIAASHANEETLSLLACAAAFAIISFSEEGRQQLVEARHLARALNRLGRTSQVECQQYAALAACNVASIQSIWSQEELQDFTVIALLRANSPQAKQIHAKTLANLLSHAKTRPKAVSDGVLYALMKLSQMTPAAAASQPVSEDAQDPKHTPPLQSPVSSTSKPVPVDPAAEVFHLGLQVLFNLSCEAQYHCALLGKGVIAYLAAAVVVNKQHVSDTPASSHESAPPTASLSSTAQSTNPPQLAASVGIDSRRLALGIVCNLSSYEVNHGELMNAQVLDVIRSYVDPHDIETRASAAMAVRNLSCQQPWVELLCERRTLQMLISFTLCDHAVVRHFTIQALANCSRVADSLHLFGELQITRAVLAVLDAAKTLDPSIAATITSMNTTSTSLPALSASAALVESRDTSMAALKCLHNIAVEDTLALNLMEDAAVLRLLPVLEGSDLGESEDACMLTATVLRVLAGKQRCAEALLKQRVVSFCALLHRKHPRHPGIAFACAAILMRLSTYQSIQAALAETQAIQVLVDTCASSCSCEDPRIRACAAVAIRNLSLCVAEPMAEFYDEASFEEEAIAIARAQSKRRASGSKLPSRRPAGVHEIPVSRLVERHLLLGVKHLQGEFQRFLPDASAGENACPISERVLVEASVGLANLSTVKQFRVAMVRSGVVPTLLQVFQPGHRRAVPSIVHSICSATLHRLALEDETTVNGSKLLVPSLLEILELADEELQQVRYECEKVSLPAGPGSCMRVSRAARRASSKAPVPSPQRTSSSQGDTTGFKPEVASPRQDCGQCPPALIATTTCVQQSYREAKWTAFIVRTTLSSSSMVPPLEKKQIRPVGLPRLACFDTDGALFLTLTQPQQAESSMDGPIATLSDDCPAKRMGGYLLSAHMEKSTAYLAACQQDGGDVHASFSREGWGLQLATSRSNTSVSSARDSALHDREAMLHVRKFDRHMRLSRRNHRRGTNMLPVVSFM